MLMKSMTYHEYVLVIKLIARNHSFHAKIYTTETCMNIPVH